MARMPTTLCFDLDNTLLDDDASLQACVRRVCDDLVGHLPPFDAEAMTREYIALSDAYWEGRPYVAAALPDARLKFWTETLAAYGCDDPSVILHARDAYAAWRYNFAVTYDETLHAMESLRGRYRLAVITNGAGEQQRTRIRAAGLEGYFDVIVASSDIDAGKPDAAVFEHTLRLLGASQRETWHIGDSLAFDVQGAHNAGLGAAVWLNRRALKRAPSDPEPHYEVESLQGFVRLLEGFEG
jgi:HAD superfamily hydrolase (TIGR01549 family)